MTNQSDEMLLLPGSHLYKSHKKQESADDLIGQLESQCKKRKSSVSRKATSREYLYSGGTRVKKSLSKRARPKKQLNDKQISAAESTDIDNTEVSADLSADAYQQADISWVEADTTAEEELNSLIDELAPDSRHHQIWHERQEVAQESWEHIRPYIFEEVLKNSMLPCDRVCSICGEKEILLRCMDCGPSNFFCSSCDQEVHRLKPLHDRELWKDGFFQPIPPTSICVNDQIVFQERCIPLTLFELCPLCGVGGNLGLLPRVGMRVFVNLKGRFDLNDATIMCHNCNTLLDLESPKDVIREHCWIGSTDRQSRYIFDQHLFTFYDLLQKNNPGLSECGFLKTLEQFSEIKGRKGFINPSTFSKAFDEWRYCQYSVHKEEGIPLFECPCCTPYPHSIHLDGNRKLYRYSKVPRGFRKSYYEEDFIVANEKVDKHLDNVGYTLDVNDGNICGTTRWKAAKAVSKTMTNLDECGIEIAGRRHGFGLKSLNMFRGELYGYPHYLHVNFFRKAKHIWGDVICLYWPWALKKSEKEDSYAEAMNAKPCLSVMHAKAHSWSCQILWGGRWQEGAAYGSGEDMEQLFSYLSRFNNTTKNMSASGREEHLTEAVLFWNSRKLYQLSSQLSLRLTQVRKEMSKAKLELLQLQETVGEDLTAEFCKMACTEVQKVAKEEADSNHNSTRPIEIMAEYFKLKQHLASASQLQDFLHSTNEAYSLMADTEKLFHEVNELSSTLVEKRQRLDRIKTQLAENGILVDTELSDDNVNSKCEEAAIQLVIQKLQEKIEYQYLHMQRRHSNIQKQSTSSKQRARLRHAISEDKVKLKKLLQQYNTMISFLPSVSDTATLTTSTCTLSEEELYNGQFPWSQLSGRHSMSIQRKLQVADVYNRINRLKEEEKLIHVEMKQFIVYFGETIPNRLKASIEAIQRNQLFIHDIMDSSDGEENSYLKRYVAHISMHYTSSSSELCDIKKGMLAIKYRGLHKAKSILNNAIINWKWPDRDEPSANSNSTGSEQLHQLQGVDEELEGYDSDTSECSDEECN